MNRDRLRNAVLFVIIQLIRPLGYVLSEGYVHRGPKDFVYDID
jgi:hypothetical protein